MKARGGFCGCLLGTYIWYVLKEKGNTKTDDVRRTTYKARMYAVHCISKTK